MRQHPNQLRKDPQFQAIAATIKRLQAEMDQHKKTIDSMVSEDYCCYTTGAGDVSFYYLDNLSDDDEQDESV